MSDQPPSDRPPSRRNELGFDELIAIAVAFASIGAVLWWGLSRTQDSWSVFTGQVAPSPTASPSPVFPLQQESPSPVAGTVDRSAEPPAVSASPSEAFVSPSPTVVVPEAVAPPVVVAPVPVPAASPTPAVTVAPPAGLTVPSPSAEPLSFPDVPSTYWAYPFITALSQRGIVAGLNDGTFKPEQPITRAEYAALIETIFKSPPDQNPIAFQDVPPDFWGTQAVDTAVKTGFLKGYPGNIFQPDQPMPRLQVLVSLVNGLRVQSPTDPEQAVQVYQDNSLIPDWALASTAAATEAGIVVNHPNPATLNPNKPATRAEVAAMIHQALVAAGTLQPVQSNYIVRP